MNFVIEPTKALTSQVITVLKDKDIKFKYFLKGFTHIYLQANATKYINEYGEDSELVYDTLYELERKSLIRFKQLKSVPKPQANWNGQWVTINM